MTYLSLHEAPINILINLSVCPDREATLVDYIQVMVIRAVHVVITPNVPSPAVVCSRFNRGLFFVSALLKIYDKKVLIWISDMNIQE
jgi:hypothetical protein